MLLAALLNRISFDYEEVCTSCSTALPSPRPSLLPSPPAAQIMPHLQAPLVQDSFASKPYIDKASPPQMAEVDGRVYIFQ